MTDYQKQSITCDAMQCYDDYNDDYWDDYNSPRFLVPTQLSVILKNPKINQLNLWIKLVSKHFSSELVDNEEMLSDVHIYSV